MSNANTTSRYGAGFCGTPLQLFKSFLFVLPDGTLDASKIHSRECYLHFLTIRHAVDTDREMQKFRRTLSNQLSGVDGRTPFLPEEERAILLVLRVKRQWPCVPENSAIGTMGFRSKGYHEKQADGGLPAQKKRKITTKKDNTTSPIAAASISDQKPAFSSDVMFELD
jgi:hypothetical protein